MSLALLATITFFSFLCEATLGFGSTILAVTLAANLFPIHVLLPTLVPVNLVLSIVLIWRHHDAISFRVLLGRILPLMGLGMPVGLFLFSLRESQALQISFACFVILLSIVELGRAWRQRHAPPVPRPLHLGASIVLLVSGGVIHGVYGSGGPMAVYYASREVTEKRAFRSTLSALWFVLNVVLLTSYAFTGALTTQTAKMSAVLVAPMVLALVLGEVLHARVRPEPFRLLIYALLLVAGAILLHGGLSAG